MKKPKVTQLAAIDFPPSNANFSPEYNTDTRPESRFAWIYNLGFENGYAAACNEISNVLKKMQGNTK